jgi:hypothetical protein
MNLNYYLKGQIQNLVFATFSCIGAIWTLIEFSSFFITEIQTKFKDNINAFLSVVLIAFIVAVVYIWPKKTIQHEFKASNTKITIKVGNIFDENNNIALPTSNFFDTVNIGPGISLKSQMINRVYNSDITSVDRLIEESLKNQNITGTPDTLNKNGKSIKYEVGTTAILPYNENKKIFLSVFTVVNYSQIDRKTETNAAIINDALIKLWNKYKVDGQQQNLSVPVFGSGLSASGFSYQLLIQIIVISFALHAKNNHFTDNLTIVIPDTKYYPELFTSLDYFLKSIEI